MSRPSQKSSRRKKGRKKGRARREFDENVPGGGPMQGMVHGFQRALGAANKEGKPNRKWGESVLTIVLIAATVAIVVWRCA